MRNQDEEQGPGRPQHKPDEKSRKQVEMTAGMGLRMSEIALVVGISVPTLRKHYKDELERGQAKANVQVAQSLFRQAIDSTKPNTIAGIFWMKARAGWRDRDEERGGKKKAEQDMADEVAKKSKFAARPVPSGGLKRVV